MILQAKGGHSAVTTNQKPLTANRHRCTTVKKLNKKKNEEAEKTLEKSVIKC